MKCIEPWKVRLENKFNYLVFTWYQSYCDIRPFFFQWLPRLHQILLSTLLLLLLPLHLLLFTISSPSNLPTTTTYCGKLRLFLTLRGNISMVISMEPHLLHLGLSSLQLMVPLKLSKTQSFITGICKIKWYSVPLYISSLSKKILAYVVKFTTSWDVWKALKRMFTSQFRARTMQIHYQLTTLKKGNSSIAEYFHQFTTLVDTLAAIV